MHLERMRSVCASWLRAWKYQPPALRRGGLWRTTDTLIFGRAPVQVLETLLAGVTSSLSAAKRYRLACLQAVVLTLLASDAPPVRLAAAAAGEDAEGDGDADVAMTEEEQRKQVCSMPRLAPLAQQKLIWGAEALPGCVGVGCG